MGAKADSRYKHTHVVTRRVVTGLTFTNKVLLLLVSMLYIPVKVFSVMGCFPVFLGWTSTNQRIKCLAQGNYTMLPVSLKLEAHGCVLVLLLIQK